MRAILLLPLLAGVLASQSLEAKEARVALATTPTTAPTPTSPLNSGPTAPPPLDPRLDKIRQAHGMQERQEIGHDLCLWEYWYHWQTASLTATVPFSVWADAYTKTCTLTPSPTAPSTGTSTATITPKPTPCVKRSTLEDLLIRLSGHTPNPPTCPKNIERYYWGTNYPDHSSDWQVAVATGVPSSSFQEWLLEWYRTQMHYSAWIYTSPSSPPTSSPTRTTPKPTSDATPTSSTTPQPCVTRTSWEDFVLRFGGKTPNPPTCGK